MNFAALQRQIASVCRRERIRRRRSLLGSSLRHYFSKTTWWQQCHSLRSSQSERQAELDFRDDLGPSGLRMFDSTQIKRLPTLQNYTETRQNQDTSLIENNNNTSRPSFFAARQTESHTDATLARSLTAQGCERVNYYRCSIITNHNLLGGPCVIYTSMLKLMGYIFISVHRCILPSQWNPSLIYSYSFL